MTENELDLRIYEDELLPWLPEEIIDIHVHIGLAEHIGPISPDRIVANWAIEVGVQQSWEQLWANCRTLFPRQKVGALAFGGVYREVDIEANNDYVLAGANDDYIPHPPIPFRKPFPSNAGSVWALMVSHPSWPAEEIEHGMEYGFAGIKPYPDLAPDMDREPGIFDFCPHSHLEVLNQYGGVMMLHLPRKARLADSDNIRELIEISDRYPSVKMIVAHIGRSFCLPTAQKGLPPLADRPSIYFDTSANLNADVFQYALETVGSDRLLFGSDLPITLMRGVREHVGETYINYTNAPYSWNTNRKSPEEEAGYTFYLYEELRALIAAVQKAGMGRDEMRKIMLTNSAKLLRAKGAD